MSYRLVAILFLAAANIWAQAQSGAIVGTLTDATGAVVPNARVTLTNIGTQFSRTVESNPNGQYSAPTVPTGEYTITVEHTGFQKLVRSGVKLTVADTLTVDLSLQIGDTKAIVEVTASAPLLQSQSAAISRLVTNEQILAMPMNGRTFTSLVLLSPGAYAGSSANLATSQYAMRGSTNISVNGSSPQNNSYLIDGVYNRNLWLSTLIMVPTVDSIQEFRIMTSNYSAEYGSASGAVTLVQTKSGTNTYHGSLYEFLRNDKLDANTFFNNRQGLPKPAFRRNEFGGTAGGPVIRDKLFFFADYQGIRIRQPATITSTIPTLAARAMVSSGGFSALGVPIFDPDTLHAGPSNTQVRDPFPNNMIPIARLDPAAVKLTQFLPAPTTSSATRNFTFNPTTAQRTDQFDVRIDQNAGPADRLFFKYSYDDTDLTTPGRLPSPANAGVPIGAYLSADGTWSATLTPLHNQSATFNYIKVVNPNTVNESRVAVVRWNQSISPIGNPFNTADAIGIPGININDKSGGLPSASITGYDVIGDNSTYPENSATTSFQYENILSLIRGSHTFKFGGMFIRHRFNGFSAFPTRGTFTFNGQYTRQIGNAGSQTALADWALGGVSGATRNVLVGTFGMRSWNLSGFADDTWRVTNRLTWNYGLRYEVLAPPYEVNNRWSNFDIVAAKLVIAGQNGAGRRLRNIDTNNLAPRMGITYMLTRDHKTVLRTGAGFSYVEAGQGGGQLYKNLPFFYSQAITTDQNAGVTQRLRDGLPRPVPPTSPNDLNGGNPTAWDMNLQSTRGMQWSIGVQRELLVDLLLDVAYVGSRTTGLIANYNINQSVPGPGAQPPRRPYFAINPFITNLTLRAGWGGAKYHSLQTRVQKRYSQGLTAGLSYTYSKYLSNGGNINGGGNAPPQDIRCLRCEWGSMPEDRRHVLVLNHIYELPLGVGRRFANRGWLAHIVGNWDISGIWSMSTGDHFTVTFPAAVSNSAGGSGDRPNRVADGNLPSDRRTIDRWFDLAAFAAPAQFTFGNSGRGILEAPGNFNVDLGVHRVFRIKERFKLNYRWEMFNSFNRANFGGPAAGIGTPTVGQISATGPARIMQMALKVAF